MGFPRQEYWSGLPFSSPGDLPDPGIEPMRPAFQADSLPSEPPTNLGVGEEQRPVAAPPSAQPFQKPQPEKKKSGLIRLGQDVGDWLPVLSIASRFHNLYIGQVTHLGALVFSPQNEGVGPAYF